MEKITIALPQMAARASAEENHRETVSLIEKCAKNGAQIVCLQELFATRYFCKEENSKNFEFAETIPGPTTERYQQLASKFSLVIIAPIFERRAPGVYHNSAAVIDADGSLLGVYRKMHIPDDPLFHEKFYFTPGDAEGEGKGFRVFDTKYAKIGVLICWDQWYPEAARITALLGAEILFYPTAIGWLAKEEETYRQAQFTAWRNMQIAHAISNGAFVAAVNRSGFEEAPQGGGIEFFGRSFVSDPFGQIVAEAKQSPELLYAECDLSLVEKTRQEWPFLRDRRIDAYSPLARRVLD